MLTISKLFIAQSYLPFQFGNTRWMYNEEKMFSSKSYCYFSMDTTGYYHNGHKFWKIESLAAPTYTPTNEGYYLFDDTAQRKVYTIDTATNQEYLLYDFSANVGDTIFSVYNGSTYGLDTVIIDSIKTINSRKYIYLHGIGNAWSEICVWIEGIGSTYDLFLPSKKIPGIFEIYLRLICHQNNNIINYGTVNECNNFLTNTQDISISNHQQLITYYNQTITIQNSNSSSYTFTLYDISGKIIHHTTSSQLYQNINTNNFPQSIYFYQLITKEGHIQKGKFINN